MLNKFNSILFYNSLLNFIKKKKLFYFFIAIKKFIYKIKKKKVFYKKKIFNSSFSIIFICFYKFIYNFY